jgi:glucosyl-dolichyl phosphate glucuronosyltransferase
MTGSARRCSVIICAFTEQRWQDLVAAVDSLARQSQTPDEIVVVIDHNPSLHERAAAELPVARVVANEHPPGESGARNTGVEVASGEVFAFMDDDAVADRSWVATLLSHYNDPQVIAVGGAVIPRWERGRPRGFPEEFDWVVGCTYRGMPTRRMPVRNLIGANMSFRREVFGVAGGFFVGIGRFGASPSGCSETEFCIRARAAFPAGVILYDPEARVSHRVPPARESWRYFGARCYREGLSKAQVTQRAGIGSALACERAHAARTIPLGVVRSLRSAVSGDRAGVARAVALMVGLWVTTIGFVVGRVRTPAPGRAIFRESDVAGHGEPDVATHRLPTGPSS